VAGMIKKAAMGSPGAGDHLADGLAEREEVEDGRDDEDDVGD
jgi:hypothetical protein